MVTFMICGITLATCWTLGKLVNQVKNQQIAQIHKLDWKEMGGSFCMLDQFMNLAAMSFALNCISPPGFSLVTIGQVMTCQVSYAKTRKRLSSDATPSPKASATELESSFATVTRFHLFGQLIVKEHIPQIAHTNVSEPCHRE